MEERKKQYWLHRITGGSNGWDLAHKLLDNNNLLSIGWGEFSTIGFSENVKRGGLSRIEERYREVGWDATSRNRHNLLRFISSMKAGDIVVVPGYKCFSIYEIYDDEVYCNEDVLFTNVIQSYQGFTIENHKIKDRNSKFVDLGFYRKVTPLCTPKASREEFAKQRLSSRMKIRITNANITDLKADINEAIDNIKANRVINLKEAIISNTTEAVFKQIQDIVDCNKFESLVEWYLRKIGAEVINTPSKNSSPTCEGDADKLAYFATLKLVIMVQVKKHRETSGSWGVDQIVTYRDYNEEPEEYSSLQWVISSAEKFSDSAIELARKERVRLIDGYEFARMIIEAGVSSINI